MLKSDVVKRLINLHNTMELMFMEIPDERLPELVTIFIEYFPELNEEKYLKKMGCNRKDRQEKLNLPESSRHLQAWNPSAKSWAIIDTERGRIIENSPVKKEGMPICESKFEMKQKILEFYEDKDEVYLLDIATEFEYDLRAVVNIVDELIREGKIEAKK